MTRRANQEMNREELPEFYVDEPEWYSRLSFPFRRSWRHELATVVAVFVLGILAGLLIR